MIDAKTTEEMVALYIGWDELEKQLANQWGTEREKIIDFNLLKPRRGEEFRSRPQVLDGLEDLYNRVGSTNNEEEFIKAKLNASMYFIRALMGEIIPFPEYVKNLTGLTPKLIPEDVIQKHKEILYARMEDVGYKPKHETFEKFFKRIVISKEEALKQVEMTRQTVPHLVQSALGFGDLAIDYEIKNEEVDDFWGAWTSKEPGQPFLLRFNFHPKKHWRNGDIKRISVHEYGHFVHGQNLMNGISTGQTNPFIGITTVHDPHTFSGEGSANAILHLPEVRKNLSKYELLSRDRVIAANYLSNNALIWANEGKDEGELIEYFRGFPFLTKEALLDSFARWKKPSRKAYEYVYGRSHYMHRQLLGKLPIEKQREFLRYEMTRYRMPERLIEFANRLFSD
jgi:hypothetical protein